MVESIKNPVENYRPDQFIEEELRVDFISYFQIASDFGSGMAGPIYFGTRGSYRPANRIYINYFKNLPYQHHPVELHHRESILFDWFEILSYSY